MRLARLSEYPTIRGFEKKLSKFSLKSLSVRKKVLTFAAAIETIAQVLWKHYISTSSTRDVVGILTYRQDYNRQIEILSKRYKQNQQRRVWSWLRMNASDRLNTCKSRGSMICSNTDWWRPAHGWVTRMQLTYQRGDSPAKVGLIPHKTGSRMGIFVKDSSLIDRHAFH